MSDQPMTPEEAEAFRAAVGKAFEACTGERKRRVLTGATLAAAALAGAPVRPPRQRDLEMRVLPRLQSGVATTEEAMKSWVGNKGRTNQAKAFLKRAKKSDARRRIEKATRKKMRRRK